MVGVLGLGVVGLGDGVTQKKTAAVKTTKTATAAVAAVATLSPAATATPRPPLQQQTIKPACPYQEKKEQRLTPGFDPKNLPSGRQCGFPENATVQSTRF